MNDNQARFGQHPEESQNLVRAWSASQPQVPDQVWGTFWQETLAKSATVGTTGQTPGMAGRFIKFGLAASLAGLAWANWPVGQHQQKLEVVVVSGQMAQPVVSINLDEADSLAIIRLDDAQCRAVPGDRGAALGRSRWRGPGLKLSTLQRPGITCR